MVMRPSPVALAMPRVLQCVSPRGVLSKGLHDYPLDVSIAYLARRSEPRLVVESFQTSFQRARRASAGWLRARWASDCSRSRSSSVKIRACLGRPVRIEASYSLDASRAKLAHLFLGQETSLCLRTRQSEWRSGGRGRTDFRRHRTLRRRTMAGRSGARAEKSKLSTATRAAGLHTQAGWEAETVRYTTLAA